MDKVTERDARLSVLGQIAVTRERLAALEATLIRKPMGDMLMTEDVADAMGNLSLQTGALVAVLSIYQSAAKR